jgi:hypothetical protein
VSNHIVLREVEEALNKRNPDYLALKVKLFNADWFRSFENESDYANRHELMTMINNAIEEKGVTVKYDYT